MTRWINSWQLTICGHSVYVFWYLMVANSISRHHSPAFPNTWMPWSFVCHWRQDQLSRSAPPLLSYHQYHIISIQDINGCFFSTNISKKVRCTFRYWLAWLVGAILVDKVGDAFHQQCRILSLITVGTIFAVTHCVILSVRGSHLYLLLYSFSTYVSWEMLRHRTYRIVYETNSSRTN